MQFNHVCISNFGISMIKPVGFGTFGKRLKVFLSQYSCAKTEC